MKMVKSLLLGTAAGLVAMTGAQAADLPVKAKPVQYVKICSLYGAGFYYIPGTDTCLKVGGFVRAEINFNAGGSFNPYRAQNFDASTRDYQTTRTRAGFTLDARSQTEYGTLRSYAIIAAMQTNGGAVGGTPYSTPFSNFAFIQFAGFTMGSTASFFEFDGQGYSNITPLWTSAQAGGGIWLAGYTAQLGNGLSASISAEDPTTRRSAITNGTATTAAGIFNNNTAAAPNYVLVTAPAGFGVSSSGYGGRRWPDVVANLRIDQAWGSAQVMGALHDVYGQTSTTSGITFSGTGYAVGGGLKINLPMLGKGDAITGQVTYAKGATNYLLSQSGAGGLGAEALTSGFPAATGTALGPIYDGVITAGNAGMDLTTGWHLTAGYEHNWGPGWKTSLYGSYGKLDYSTAASAALVNLANTSVQATVGSAAGLAVVANGSSAAAGTTAGSASWSAWQLGSRTVWTPVTNLDLSVDVVYTRVNTAFGGSVGPSTLGTYQDKGFWAGIFRAQRNFYP